jgi:hypothetical protein
LLLPVVLVPARPDSMPSDDRLRLTGEGYPRVEWIDEIPD